VGPGGAANFAPMGVEWGEDRIVLKPFLETTTFRNLTATRAAEVASLAAAPPPVDLVR
jgi:hypothetical protein